MKEKHTAMQAQAQTGQKASPGAWTAQVYVQALKHVHFNGHEQTRLSFR